MGLIFLKLIGQNKNVFLILCYQEIDNSKI